MFYKKHLFFCTNRKENGSGCGNLAGESGFEFARLYLRSLDLWGEGKYRVSKSGCLGRCKDGPVCVVYPDGIWYTYIDETDVREIIDEHLLHGKIVARLKIDDHCL